MQQALILIDMQNDYFDGGAMQLVGMREAAENARRLLQHFRNSDQPRVHIQHVSARPGATFFLPDTAGVEHHVMAAPDAGETVIQKNFPNSFRMTNLFEHLQSLQAQELILCGAMSHMCVDAITQHLCLIKGVAEIPSLVLHFCEDKIAGAVDDACRPFNLIRSQTLSHRLDDGNTTGHRRFKCHSYTSFLCCGKYFVTMQCNQGLVCSHNMFAVFDGLEYQFPSGSMSSDQFNDNLHFRIRHYFKGIVRDPADLIKSLNRVRIVIQRCCVTDPYSPTRTACNLISIASYYAHGTTTNST